VYFNQARNQWGGGTPGHLTPKIFNTMLRNFEICKNFQIMTMKFSILIIFMESYWKFVLLANYLLTRFALRQVI